MPARKINLFVRFWEKVERGDGCWTWTGHRSRAGYGKFQIDGRAVPAHRVALMMTGATFLPGQMACHRCDNPSCVNPNHLYIGTAKDNARDKLLRGRSNNPTGDRHGSHTKPESTPRGDKHYTRRRPDLVRRGERHPNAKITPETVAAIRGMAEEKPSRTQADIAAMFGICQSAVSQIIHRKKWTHV